MVGHMGPGCPCSDSKRGHIFTVLLHRGRQNAVLLSKTISSPELTASFVLDFCFSKKVFPQSFLRFTEIQSKRKYTFHFNEVLNAGKITLTGKGIIHFSFSLI